MNKNTIIIYTYTSTKFSEILIQGLHASNNKQVSNYKWINIQALVIVANKQKNFWGSEIIIAIIKNPP